MGVSFMYNSVPIASSLYQRIQIEKPICYLVNNLTIYGGGLFSFFEIDGFELDGHMYPSETDEILEDLVASAPEIFGSPAEAERIIADFKNEIEATRQNCPGIYTRTALIEKSFPEIEDCLVKELSLRNIENPQQLVSKLLMGDASLAPNLLTEDDYPLALISVNLVEQGAMILETIDPDLLHVDVPGWEKWGLEHLKIWRDLYLSAKGKNEVILVASG